MPEPKRRSRKVRHKIRLAPKHRTHVTSRRAYSPGRCCICHTKLHGVPFRRAVQTSRMTKTEKRPERPFGGNICHKCLKRAIRRTCRETYT
ncbi:MAG: 50S ribosomal protein L34e [Candidatus Hermodarchaeota archaeon]